MLVSFATTPTDKVYSSADRPPGQNRENVCIVLAVCLASTDLTWTPVYASGWRRGNAPASRRAKLHGHVTPEHVLWLRVQRLDAVITVRHGSTTSGDLGAHEGGVALAIVLLPGSLRNALKQHDCLVECTSGTSKLQQNDRLCQCQCQHVASAGIDVR
jgi:hypothetical protein